MVIVMLITALWWAYSYVVFGISGFKFLNVTNSF